VPEIFIHPQGICESNQVGEGTRIWGFAHVMAGAIVGQNCNIGGNVFVEAGAIIGNEVTVKNGVQIWDGVTLESRVFVGPNVTFTNELCPRSARPKGRRQLVPTLVQVGATIGANSTIICGKIIGRYTFIGAGSVITKDVPPYALMVGNPGHRIGWVCDCASQLSDDLFCKCGLKFEFVSEDMGLRKIA